MGVLAVAFVVPVLAAQPAQPVAATTDEGTQGRLLLVLDSSGSMREPDASGTTKIAAAKRALRSVVADLPVAAEVGMRVYGATVFDRSDPGACTDSQLVVPIAPVDKATLLQQIGRYRPYGETPIAYSLQQAAKDLGPDGSGTILLVSDGEETCHPDPCAVARQIHDRGIDLRVDVVGMSVPDQARRQLQCIADAGGGEYCETDDADELGGCLGRASLRAFREFSVSGDPVQGTTDRAGAPEIGPGRYTDTLGGDEQVTGLRYYRIPKPPGTTLHVAVTARTENPQQSDAISLGLLNSAGQECSSGGQTTLSEYQGNPVINASTIFRPDESDTFGCGAEDELLLEVRRGDEIQDRAPDTGDLPIEILVISEPAVTNRSELPRQAGEQSIDDSPVPAGPVQGPVVGGSTFSDAPLLEPGTWSDTLQSGEMLFYRVSADWGEAPRITVRMPADPALEQQIDVPGTPVTTFAYAPDQTPISLTGSDQGYTGNYLGNDEVVMGAALPPVRYRNREHYSFGTTPIGPTSLAGDYYFAVHLQDEPGQRRYQAQTTLSVDVGGTPTGAPDYVEIVEPVTETTSPPSTAPEGGTHDSQAQTRPAAAEDDGGADPALIAAAGAGGVLAASLVAAVLVWRVRSRRSGLRGGSIH